MKFQIAFVIPFILTTIISAANVVPSAVGSKTRIDLNVERAYIEVSVGMLQNELLNNEEEEYILLVPDNGYFHGFSDGMSDAIQQLGTFNYSGRELTDLAAIESNFLEAQESVDALGTTYGTGMGTAYQYAITVLKRKPAQSMGNELPPGNYECTSHAPTNSPSNNKPFVPSKAPPPPAKPIL